MKKVILMVPETVEEFREYYIDRNIREIPIRQDEGYEYKLIGWRVADDRQQASAGWLLTAYQRFWEKEVLKNIW